MTSDYNELAVETFKLHMRIKEEIEKLKNMKSELLKKMKETKKDKLVLKEGYIKIGKWKSSFSSTLNKEFKSVKDKLKKKTPDGDFTFEDAVRVYIWTKQIMKYLDYLKQIKLI